MVTVNRRTAYAPPPGPEDAPGLDADDWRRRAACRGEDPEQFFPVSSAGPALAQIAEVKNICARCPVRAACLRFALVTGQDYGIWGGLTEEKRRQLRRAGLLVPCLPCAPVLRRPATGKGQQQPRCRLSALGKAAPSRLQSRAPRQRKASISPVGPSIPSLRQESAPERVVTGACGFLLRRFPGRRSGVNEARKETASPGH